jgi:phosphatidate cytidylyltransferase
MKNVITRTLTGIIFIFVVIGSLLLHKYAFAGVFAIFLLIAVHEWINLMEKTGIKLHGALVYISSLLAFFSLAFVSETGIIVPIIILALLLPVISVSEMFRGGEHAFRNAAITFFGVVYLALPLGLLVVVHGAFNAEKPALFIIALFSIIWAYDTLAYCSGILFGKRKLWERISPKKTWEGLIGGTLLTLVLLFFANRLFVRMDDVVVLIGGLLIIVFSTFGDFFESALKRQAGIKDSGTLFPGHGGVLDRFDSVLLTVFPYMIFLYFVFT